MSPKDQPLLFLSTVLLVLVLNLPGAAATQLPKSNPTLESWVHNTAQHLHPEIQLAYPQYLGFLYRQVYFKNLWIQPSGQPTQTARQLLKELDPWLALEDHPRLAVYRQLARWLQTPLEQVSPRYRQSRDLVISDYFLRYQDDLLQLYWNQFDQQKDQGIVNHYERWDNWPDEVQPSSLAQVFPDWLARLQTQARDEWVLDFLHATRPNSQLYTPWRKAFDRLQKVAEAGPWPQVTTTLEQGDQSLEVAELIVQLARLGDLDTKQWQPRLSPDNQLPLFDQEIARALQAFQARHQLPASAKTDPETRQALNRPPHERLRRLAHNLRRLYHLPKKLHARHLQVNLADQHLQLVEENNLRLQMKVIIGRDGRRTPIMSQWLTSLVINPVWNVPPSIARETILPRARNDPEYLASRDYTLVEGWQTPARTLPLDKLPTDAFDTDRPNYRLVQKAGPHNQLGRTKFRLSNRQAIYLHDTPYRQLFAREQRALSSGCVRLEDAEQLAVKLLEPSGWTQKALTRVYNQEEERYLNVRPRVAVYLMYWTAWTDAQGQLQWRDDIYQLDRFARPQQLAQQQALHQGSSKQNSPNQD